MDRSAVCQGSFREYLERTCKLPNGRLEPDLLAVKQMHCPQPESHLNFIATQVLHRLHSRDNKEDISALNHVSVTFFSKKNEKTQKATPPN